MRATHTHTVTTDNGTYWNVRQNDTFYITGWLPRRAGVRQTGIKSPFFGSLYSVGGMCLRCASHTFFAAKIIVLFLLLVVLFNARCSILFKYSGTKAPFDNKYHDFPLCVCSILIHWETMSMAHNSVAVENHHRNETKEIYIWSAMDRPGEKLIFVLSVSQTKDTIDDWVRKPVATWNVRCSSSGEWWRPLFSR